MVRFFGLIVEGEIEKSKNKKKTTDNSLTGPGGGPGDISAFRIY